MQLTEAEVENTQVRKWPIFESKIQGLWELVMHREYFRKYLQRQCEIFAKDGIYRIEARGMINILFDDDHQPLPLE